MAIKTRDIKRLIKIVVLSNMVGGNSINNTILLSGKHGIGKTAIMGSVCKELNGDFYSIEATTTGPGEVTGMPMQATSKDGMNEIRYIKHYIFNSVLRLQKMYYETLMSTGFLNGKVKGFIDEKGNLMINDHGEIKVDRTKHEIVKEGEDNCYKFGKALSTSTKLELLESGEIAPIMILIDEINRAEMLVMKELMNVLLEGKVNGYDIPWFVSLTGAQNPGGQNTSYAAIEMDPAQLSRFIKIVVESDFEDWSSYAIDSGMNPDLVEALSTISDVFDYKSNSTEDDIKMTPDPRAWSLLSNIYNLEGVLRQSKFFSNQEKGEMPNDIKRLVRGKVGDEAGNAFITAMGNKEKFVKATDILTGKSKEVSENVKNKLQKVDGIQSVVIGNNVIKFLNDNMKEIKAGKGSADKEKLLYTTNILLQLKDFIFILPQATQETFLLNMLHHQNGGELWSVCSSAFAKDVLLKHTELINALKKA